MQETKKYLLGQCEDKQITNREIEKENRQFKEKFITS